MDSIDVEAVSVLGCLGILVIALCLCLGSIAADGFIYNRGTFDAQVACKAKRMTPERKFLTSHVVCVPATMRQDTTTVQVR